MEEFRSGFTQLIHNVAVKKALDHLHPVVNEVNHAKATFGRVFGTLGIGQPQNPFGGGNWKDLSQRWLARKKATLGDQRFYYGITGNLHTAIYGIADENLFGPCTLDVRNWIWEQDTGFYNPRIKRRIETVFRTEAGRFASRSEAKTKPIQVKIKPFPLLKNTQRDIVKALPISDDEQQKLGRNDTLRPLVVPFMEYFYKNKILSVIKGYMRNFK